MQLQTKKDTESSRAKHIYAKAARQDTSVRKTAGMRKR